MNYKIEEPKVVRVLAALGFIVYFASYVTRINYSAIIAEIIQKEGVLKSTASIVTVVGFISYGIGQLLSGYIGDRLPPKRLIFSGLATSSVLNVLMPVVGSIKIMTVLWLFNGFAQAMIWPPLVKILTIYLKRDDFKRACVTISIASSVGTVSIYTLSPLIIAVSGWKTVFLLTGMIGTLISIIWIWGAGKLERYAHENRKVEEVAQDTSIKAKVTIKSTIIPSGFVFIACAIVLQGTLRDGVTTWMPSYLIETFHLNNSISIFFTVVLPICSILFLKLAAYIQRRFIRNELACAAVFFFAGFAVSVFLSVFSDCNVATSIALTALITGCMNGVNIILICLIPGHYEHTGRVAYISGILNFFTYVGSALSTYGIAKLSENYGWQFTIKSWAVIALLGMIVCSLCIRRWRRFSE
jgi:OPA family glycerol-3-phosphate transporter-like MFS transporter